ncbi:MAG TPA: hypothetical protein VGD43_11380 [Micromonospora sp.]
MSKSSVAATPYRTGSMVTEPDGGLGEIPLPPYVTGEDAGFAVRAVVVHAPEAGATGDRCRNDGAPHPCRLHRWGRRVLALRGLTPAEVDRLVERDAPGTADRPSPDGCRTTRAVA